MSTFSTVIFPSGVRYICQIMKRKVARSSASQRKESTSSEINSSTDEKNGQEDDGDFSAVGHVGKPSGKKRKVCHDWSAEEGKDKFAFATCHTSLKE